MCLNNVNNSTLVFFSLWCCCIYSFTRFYLTQLGSCTYSGNFIIYVSLTSSCTRVLEIVYSYVFPIITIYILFFRILLSISRLILIEIWLHVEKTI